MVWLAWEYACDHLLGHLYIGVLPPLKCSIKFFPSHFLIIFLSLTSSQVEIEFTTQKGVVQASFIILLSFFIYRPHVEHLSRQEYVLCEVCSNKWQFTSINSHSQPSGVYLFMSNWLLFPLVQHKQEQDNKHIQQPSIHVHHHFHQPHLLYKWRLNNLN